LLIQNKEIKAFNNKEEFKQINDLLIDKDIELAIDGVIS